MKFIITYVQNFVFGLRFKQTGFLQLIKKSNFYIINSYEFFTGYSVAHGCKSFNCWNKSFSFSVKCVGSFTW